MLRSHVLSALITLAALASPVPAQCLDWRAFPLQLSPIRDEVYTTCVHDDGTGSAIYFGSDQAGARVQRWNGDHVEAVGIITSGWIGDLLVFDDGSGPALYAAGSIVLPGVVGDSPVARWNGATWQSLGTQTGFNGATDLQIHDDGTGPALYVSGGFTSIGGTAGGGVAKWNGATWSSVGVVPYFSSGSVVRRLASFDDGSGPALMAYSDMLQWVNASNGYARWRNGAWSFTTDGPYGANRGMCTWDHGSGERLYVAGDFGARRFDGTTWQDIGAPLGRRGLAVLDVGFGPRLFAGAPIGQPVASWDAGTWTQYGTTYDHGPCVFGDVVTMCVYDDGDGPALYAGGNPGVTGVLGSGLNRWTGSEWVAVGSPRRGIDGLVRALHLHDAGAGPELYAGGYFCGGDDHALSRGVIRWDGARWQTVGGANMGFISALTSHVTGGSSRLYAVDELAILYEFAPSGWITRNFNSGTNQYKFLALQSFQGALYVGGVFRPYDDYPSANIARWNGTSLQWNGEGLTFGNSGQVNALTTFDDGSGLALYAGGLFNAGNGVPLSNVGRWSGTQWTALGLGTNGMVDAFCVFDDGSGPALYAGGDFTSAGGVPATNVARWNGTSWSALGSGLAGQVLSLESFDDGSGIALYAGGVFHSVQGAASFVARWNGTSWTRLANGPNQVVWALRSHDDGTGPQLFTGGNFTAVGSRPSRAFAAWRGCGTDEIERFCFGDGSTVDCPCGDNSAVTRGCNNSANTGGARLYAVGSASADTIELIVGGELPNAATLVFQGDALLSTPILFGDGLRCVGGNLVRMYTRNAVNGGLSVPSAGDDSIRTRSAQRGDPLAPGAIRGYQAWYRDANATFCGPPLGGAWNLSNGVRIVW